MTRPIFQDVISLHKNNFLSFILLFSTEESSRSLAYLLHGEILKIVFRYFTFFLISPAYRRSMANVSFVYSLFHRLRWSVLTTLNGCAMVTMLPTVSSLKRRPSISFVEQRHRFFFSKFLLFIHFLLYFSLVFNYRCYLIFGLSFYYLVWFLLFSLFI